MTTHQGFDIVRTFLNFANLGAAWVMWLMVGLGVALCAIVGERALMYRRTRVNAPSMGRALIDFLEHGQVDNARHLLSRGLGMEERVISDGLSAWHRGRHAVELIMKSSLERERQRFERSLGFI